MAAFGSLVAHLPKVAVNVAKVNVGKAANAVGQAAMAVGNALNPNGLEEEEDMEEEDAFFL